MVSVSTSPHEHSPTPEAAPPSHDRAIAAAEKKLHDVSYAIAALVYCISWTPILQMAEMYADLMELNERLHRNLADKDNTICALVRSLREASIEVRKLPSLSS